ncbi:CpaF family protein [Rothia mucilaginosa]|uniref:CpaF family protein n=1 Tax=Rothia mucilaginosa TaxID=43675 RepID=UPI0028E1A73B|nr:ATPase, T2SS/T4P/T4SS family [Rothia mucilaginosa]
MDSPLLRQRLQQTENPAPTPTAADAIPAVQVEVAPYGFDPMGATPLVPISPAHNTTTASASASATAVKPAASASSVSEQVSASADFSSEPVIPAALLQKWDDVEAIQAQVSNRLSLEEDQMNELSLQGQQMKTRDMIALAVNSHVTTLLDLDGDRDRWTPAYVQEVQQAVFDSIYRLGRFQALIDIPEVENIHIAGCDRVFLKFADGRTERADPVAATDAELMQMIQGIASNQGDASRPFSTSHPDLDMDLLSSIRLAAIAPPVAARPSLVMRLHRYIDISLEQLEQLGTLTAQMRQFLVSAIVARKSIVIAGEPGDGKTTLMRALAACIDPWAQVVTIEKERELHLNQQPHRVVPVIDLQAHPGSSERDASGRRLGAYTLEECVEKALRLNSAHIMVGEVRGSEIIALIEAMQINGGTFCTLHAHEPNQAIDRLVGLALEKGLTREYVSSQVAENLDFIVQMRKMKDPETGKPRRVITHVCEVLPAEGSRQATTHNIFSLKPGYSEASFDEAPSSPKMLKDLKDAGWVAPQVGA